MINFNIHSEDSEVHWPHFDVQNKIVLDLGCGRAVYHSDELQQSPLYIGEKLNALKVVGIDGNPENNKQEINRLKQLVEDLNLNSNNKYTFIWKMITDSNDLRNLLTQHNITAIKCDIEGYETRFYDLNAEDMSLVEVFALEYHTLDILENFKQKFEEWGFVVYGEGKFTYCNAPQAGVLLAKKK